MTSPGEALKGGQLNAAISNAIVALLSENVGRGPTKDFVLDMRHAFQETMSEELVAAVETHTGRKVVAFMSTNHVDPDLAAELFVLDEETTRVPATVEGASEGFAREAACLGPAFLCGSGQP